MAVRKNEAAGSQEPVPDIIENPSLSRDASNSTYRVNDDVPETRPPAGRHVIQELGEPKES